jgi:tetratricopeptide (TPR) repeat protein
MEALAAENPADNRIAAELADRHVALGIILRESGRSAQGLSSDLTGAAIQELVVAHAPSDESLRDLAGIYGIMSDACADIGDLDKASAYNAKAMEVTRRMFEADPASARLRRDMWASYFRTAWQLALRGDLPGARENYDKAVLLIEELAAADPADKGHRHWLAATYAAQASLHASTDEPAQALDLYRKAIGLSEQLCADDRGRVEERYSLAGLYQSVAPVLLKTGQKAHALEYLNKARSLAEASVSQDPQNLRGKERLAEIYGELGIFFHLAATEREHGASQRATDWFRRSREMWEELKKQRALTPSEEARSSIPERALAEAERVRGPRILAGH